MSTPYGRIARPKWPRGRGQPIDPRARRNDALTALGGEVGGMGAGAGVSVPNATFVKAQANWSYTGPSPPSQGGAMATVSVKRCTDATGGTVTGSAFTAYLPTPPSTDPNVVAGQVMGCHLTPEGHHIIYGTQDGWIGQLRMDVVTADAKEGWAIADGVANSVANGGSGVNLSDRFIYSTDGTPAVGTTGGSSTATVPAHDGSAIAALLSDHPASSTTYAGAHSHTGSSLSSDSTGITVSAHSLSVDSSTTSITVASHTGSTGYHSLHVQTGYAVINDPGHQHSFNDLTSPTDVDGGTGVDVVTPSDDTDFADSGITDSGHTHPLDFTSHNHDLGTLTHTVTDPGHSHPLLGTQTHTVNETPHSHTLTIVSDGSHYHDTPVLAHSGSGSLTHDPISILPPYIRIAFFERLDNAA